MVKKRVDPRVRGLIENGVRKNHRSLIVLVGDHGKDQVENLHRILSKARVKSRPSVLWCYKKELGFSTHRQKRIKEIKKLQARGLYDAERDDPFDLFISSTNIRWTYYKESDKVLGQTFGMCVLQDFEGITPNLLARTIETVEGGGLVILLIKTVKSLKQLYTMTMDVHNRFRTEAHHEVVPRFNERFILSLGDCQGCLVLDDELNILPISSNVQYLPAFDGDAEGLADGDADLSGYYIDPELTELKASLTGTPHVANLVEMTKTLDQAKAVMSFLDAISEKTLRSTVSLTAGRGRGKSAAIGLCLAGSVAFGYSNIFVTAPSPENLKTCFEFIIEGLKALKYVEHLDFEIIQEYFNDLNGTVGNGGKLIVRINIFRNHRQTIQYISPNDHVKLAQAELVAIDEAAAIPLPTVKKLMGPYLVFLSSTINGYEGTGRSLSLKLIQQLRAQQGAAIAAAATQAGSAIAGPKGKKGDRKVHEERWKVAAQSAANFTANGGNGTTGGVRNLVEISLQVPIRYGTNDPVEKWLNDLLCLDVTANSTRLLGVMPAPKDCELYIVDRDALFSYHRLAESLLQKIWALYTSAHYKNSPNDLQMLSDAPAHRLFVLLGPQTSSASSSSKKTDGLPDVLCIIQVAFEGRISQKSVQTELAKGNKASGDMIPWTIAQQYNDNEFATLSGARIVRIATHPDVQKMGYGARAMDLLIKYFQGEMTVDTITPGMKIFGGEGSGNALAREAMERSGNEGETIADLLNESIAPKAKLPPLLTPIADRPAERLHWLGVSFGLTTSLLSFWSRKSFHVTYLRQTANDLTGEHSCIALKELDCHDLEEEGTPQSGWLAAYVQDYRKRLINLMGFSFRHLETALALTLLDPDRVITSTNGGPGNANGDADDGIVTGSDGGISGASLTRIQRDDNTITAHELITVHINHHDLKRLELYSRNMVDHHMILDLIPAMTRLLFQGKLTGVRMSYLQAAILLSIGIQHRDVDELCTELDLPSNQVLAFFNKTIRKITSFFRSLIEQDTARELVESAAGSGRKMASNESLMRIEKRARTMVPLTGATLQEDLAKDAKEFMKVKAQQKQLIMANKDLTAHQLDDADEELLLKSAEEVMNRKGSDAMPTVLSLPKAVDPAASSGKRKMMEEELLKGAKGNHDSTPGHKHKKKKHNKHDK